MTDATDKTAGHTPTPWETTTRAVGGPGIYGEIDGRRRLLAAIDSGGLSPIPLGTQDANAAFIVRAANSHAALVAALESLLTTGPFEGRMSDAEIRKQARAALAAAKGE